MRGKRFLTGASRNRLIAGLGDFEGEEGDVVVENEVGEEEGFEEALGEVSVEGATADDVEEVVGGEEVAAGADCFENAVGHKQHAVAGLEGGFESVGVLDGFAGEEGKLRLEREVFDLALAHEEGRGVAGGGEGDFAGGDVEPNDERGDEAAEADSAAKFAVDEGKEVSGSEGGGGVAEEGSFEHGGAEGGRNAVAGDVADHDDEVAIGAEQCIDKISADVVERVIDECGAEGGMVLEVRRQEIALYGAGLEKFVLHAFGFADEMVGEGVIHISGGVDFVHGVTSPLEIHRSVWGGTYFRGVGAGGPG